MRDLRSSPRACQTMETFLVKNIEQIEGRVVTPAEVKEHGLIASSPPINGEILLNIFWRGELIGSGSYDGDADFLKLRGKLKEGG